MTEFSDAVADLKSAAAKVQELWDEDLVEDYEGAIDFDEVVNIIEGISLHDSRAKALQEALADYFIGTAMWYDAMVGVTWVQVSDLMQVGIDYDINAKWNACLYVIDEDGDQLHVGYLDVREQGTVDEVVREVVSFIKPMIATKPMTDIHCCKA